MTNQDDLFLGPALALQWTFAESPSSGTPPGYSFTSDPGNITIDVTTLATLMQAVIWTDYYIEVGITEDNATAATRFGGLRIQSAVSGTYIELAKYFDTVSGLPRLRATSYIANSPTTINDIAYAPATNIILRIQKHDGFFTFFYMKTTDSGFTQMTNTFAVTSAYSTSTGNLVGIEAGGNNSPDYNFLANHFYFRSMSDIVTNGSVVLAVTRKVVVNGSVVIGAVTFPPTPDFTVRQYADQRLVQLNWGTPVIQGVSQITLKSPAGNIFDVMIDDAGGIETEASSKTPLAANPIVESDSDSFFTISVDDDGTVVATFAPGATIDQSVAIMLDTSPGPAPLQLYVAMPGALATRPVPYTYLGTTIVRNMNRTPMSITDGTVLLSSSFLLELLDGPLPGLSRYYYAAFAIYTAKATVASADATMPIFDNLYKNTGRKRFSRVFLSGPWSQIYALARLITTLVDVDIPAAMAQFNLQTATGYFANLWGQMFGSRRYPGEADQPYTARILSRVLLPRTVASTIIKQVLAVPGVYYCDIVDANNASMFIGHSYVGFSGVAGYETQGDSIVFDPVDNPFYFTVQIKILQSANLALILQAINDNKGSGTRFSVWILETI